MREEELKGEARGKDQVENRTRIKESGAQKGELGDEWREGGTIALWAPIFFQSNVWIWHLSSLFSHFPTLHPITFQLKFFKSYLSLPLPLCFFPFFFPPNTNITMFYVSSFFIIMESNPQPFYHQIHTLYPIFSFVLTTSLDFQIFVPGQKLLVKVLVYFSVGVW